MSENPGIDGLNLKAFADAFVSSANRCRYIIMLIIAISIIAFIAFWNSRQGSWLNNRLPVTRTAYRLMKCSNDSARIDSLFRADSVLYRNAQEYLRIRQFVSTDDLMQRLNDMERVRTERMIMIQVPIFGVSIDVNDLGLLGGFTFVVILLWLRFSLSKEYCSLHIVFQEARKKGRIGLETCYRYLAMRQVLTVPQPVGDMLPQSRRRFWNNLPHSLIWLPFVVQTIVLVNDLQTFHLGEITKRLNALIGLIGGFVFLLILLFLSIASYCLVLDTDKEWNKAAWEIEQQREEEEKAKVEESEKEKKP